MTTSLFNHIRGVRAEFIILGLLAITVLLWVLYFFSGKRTLVISPRNCDGITVTAVSDRRDGGNSVAELKTTRDYWQVDYELRDGHPYPFGMLQLDVNRNGKGLDLTKYEDVIIQVGAEDSMSRRVRLQIRNFHPDYASLDDSMSMKYNEVHLPTSDIRHPVTLPWKYFHVASWWIGQRRIPLEHTHMDVSNVYWIQILTPETPPLGKGVVTLKQIRFEGKWIPEAAFFKLLLVMWMVVLLLFVVGKLVVLQQALKQKVMREEELLKLNNILAIQAEELKEQATKDELTGLLNRFGLRNRLYTIIENVKQNGLGLTAIMADIDHFKQINDTLGHDEGDRILKYVSDFFSRNMRSTDVLCRWGGEEFLFFCEGTQIEDGWRLAEKLRKALAESDECITCSFGVAALSGGSLRNLITRADNALYEAKENGRNCVAVSTEQPDGTTRTSIPGAPF
ncbi:MAG: GGDEF domain-containing protein [Deltaproteobacteria bacterium]|nr:GGDEF domain-containing protein [Deltaproteobacteria bacterium]